MTMLELQGRSSDGAGRPFVFFDVGAKVDILYQGQNTQAESVAFLQRADECGIVPMGG